LKFSTAQAPLLTSLQTVGRALSSRAATQALSGVLLEAKGGSLTLRATDTELAIETSLDAELEGDGTVLLPGRLTADVVRSLGEEKVTVEQRVAERDVELTAGSSRFHLRTLPAEDFPRFPELSGDPVALPTAASVSTVEVVARAASRDDMRPVLTGVLVTAAGRELTMVATDSYRLAVKRVGLERELRSEVEANVPARALRELSRIAVQEEAEEIEVWLLANQAVFRAGPVTVATRLIEGQFPNYRQLLPESYEHDVRISRSELLAVTRRVSQLAQRNAPLRLAFSAGELTVAAETPDVGDAVETIPVSFEGEPLEIGFNAEFLRDGIESIEGEELLFRLISPLRPGLLQPVEGDDFSYLVMPIRLNV
jgi:DNA polymerase III subunit beta